MAEMYWSRNKGDFSYNPSRQKSKRGNKLSQFSFMINQTTDDIV